VHFTACSGEHYEKRGSFNSVLREILTPRKKLSTAKCSQKVTGKAYKEIQRLIWNFHSENSAEKMLLGEKQKLTCSRKVVKLKKDFNSKEEDLLLVR